MIVSGVIETSAKRCATCPRFGKLRKFRDGSGVLCPCCAFDFEVALSSLENVPLPIEAEVSFAIRRLVK